MRGPTRPVFSGSTLIEARDVDDDAFVRTIAEGFLLVEKLDLEYKRAAIEF